MKRIVFDTSSSRLSVGLFVDATCAASQFGPDEVAQQSRHLFSVIERLLVSQNLTADDIEGIAVGQGPGSYTGLRVGLAAAKTWAHLKRIPLFTFNSKNPLNETLKREPEAPGPSVQWLGHSDFLEVQDLAEFSPLYENDHFEKSGAI